MWIRSSTNHWFCSSSPRPIASLAAQHRVRRQLDVEQDRRMAVRVVVRERRILEELDARHVAVDQEQRGQPRVAVHHVDHHDVVVGDVAGRDEPLLGAQAPAAGLGALGRAGDAAGVRAGLALGDGVGVAALAAQRRLQVPLDLLRRARPPARCRRRRRATRPRSCCGRAPRARSPARGSTTPGRPARRRGCRRPACARAPRAVPARRPPWAAGPAPARPAPRAGSARRRRSRQHGRAAPAARGSGRSPRQFLQSFELNAIVRELRPDRRDEQILLAQHQRQPPRRGRIASGS